MSKIAVPRIHSDRLRDMLACKQMGWHAYRDGTVLPPAAELIKMIREQEKSVSC